MLYRSTFPKGKESSQAKSNEIGYGRMVRGNISLTSIGPGPMNLSYWTRNKRNVTYPSKINILRTQNNATGVSVEYSLPSEAAFDPKTHKGIFYKKNGYTEFVIDSDYTKWALIGGAGAAEPLVQQGLGVLGGGAGGPGALPLQEGDRSKSVSAEECDPTFCRSLRIRTPAKANGIIQVSYDKKTNKLAISKTINESAMEVMLDLTHQKHKVLDFFTDIIILSPQLHNDEYVPNRRLPESMGSDRYEILYDDAYDNQEWFLRLMRMSYGCVFPEGAVSEVQSLDLSSMFAFSANINTSPYKYYFVLIGTKLYDHCFCAWYYYEESQFITGGAGIVVWESGVPKSFLEAQDFIKNSILLLPRDILIKTVIGFRNYVTEPLKLSSIQIIERKHFPLNNKQQFLDARPYMTRDLTGDDGLGDPGYETLLEHLGEDKRRRQVANFKQIQAKFDPRNMSTT